MKNKNELNYKDLKMNCNPNIFNFDSTAELEAIQDGIGQERGIKALEFGLQVDLKGYNLYLEGPSGVGKTSYTRNYLNKISAKKKFLLTGVMFIIFRILMSLLQLNFLLEKVKNSKMIWMDLLKKSKKIFKKHLIMMILKKKKL